MEFVEATIDSIRVSLGTQAKVLILRMKDNDKFLPIWIGEFGAESISIKIQNILLPRPNTHDFMIDLINTLGCTLKSIGIIGLENDTYYANAIFDFNGTNYNIDCMPSDGVALAVRTGVPIFVAKDLFDNSVEPNDFEQL